MCTLIEQLRRRRSDLGFSLTTLEKRTGFALPRLSVIFNRPKAVDLRLSSVEALADALDARVMVVPKESVALVQSLLSSHASLMAVEQTPSALERALSDAVNDERAVSVPRCVSRRDAGWPSIEDGRYCAIFRRCDFFGKSPSSHTFTFLQQPGRDHRRRGYARDFHQIGHALDALARRCARVL